MMRTALNNADSRFAQFPFFVRQLQLSLNWSHGDIPTNQYKFGMYNDEERLCSFDFEVEAFQHHIEEALADSELNQQFMTQVH